MCRRNKPLSTFPYNLERNTMKNLKTLFIISALVFGSHVANAASHAGAPMGTPMTASSAMSAAAMADGEIRKVDMESKKITIKHGEIKNLDMPGMTMVFQVKDAALLDKVKVGDKVKFSAEKSGGAIVVTDIQAAKQ
jgi:Cu(I)/Ag(I) efflux system protein CusF